MNKREMLIDLTPLLDVILIILFMVLMSNNSVTSKEVRSLQNQVERLQQTQMPTSLSQKAWQLSFYEDIDKVNVIYPPKDSKRTIYLVHANEEVVEKPTSVSVTDWLLREIKDLPNEVVLLSFTYNNDQIYYQEYRNMVDAIHRLNKIQGKKIIYSEYVDEDDWINQDKERAHDKE